MKGETLNIKQNYRNILIESQLFPPISFFAVILDFEMLKLEACENFQKRSYRNRYRIGSTQGVLELSIPLVKGKNQQQSIRDVMICRSNNWPVQHLRALQSSYGKTAYFQYYKDELQDLFMNKTSYLFEFNVSVLECLINWLGLRVSLEFTKQFELNAAPGSLDLRNQIKLKQSISNQIIPYYQVYSEKIGFIPNLSILDLLFHKGPESIFYLQQIQKLTVNKDSLLT